MRRLSDTVARLSAMAEARHNFSTNAPGGRLQDLISFGSNPGALGAKTYIPADLPAGAALVVVLHGCTQTADAYDLGSGWSRLAEREGFATLFPEQRRANNPSLCFNWFSPADARRDRGEALSIRQMIAAVVDAHGIDPRRVFVTGLSAGGAMASVLLATYPEVFAGGAIIAGLPYGSANTVPEAFDRMRGHGGPPEADLAALVRRASHHAGPWPTISVWHGSGDATVDPVNAAAVVAQWRALHNVAAAPAHEELVDGYPRRVWRDADGRDVIEEYSITGMGHGTPLATQGADPIGEAGAYMLEAHISSTLHIARFWGLLGRAGRDRAAAAPIVRPSALGALSSRAAGREGPQLQRETQPGATPREQHAGQAQATTGVARIIEDALRAAGLMR